MMRTRLGSANKSWRACWSGAFVDVNNVNLHNCNCTISASGMSGCISACAAVSNEWCLSKHWINLVVLKIIFISWMRTVVIVSLQ